jgi:hypothetical protein
MLDPERPEDINARLTRYAATLDGRDLWPEVTASGFRAGQAELARVVAAVLAGEPSPVPLRLPSETDARALGIAASAAGIGPLLGLWCSTGRITADPTVADQLATHLTHGRRRAARLRRELERVLVPLAERGIEPFVLKGSHTGYRYFPEPGTRPATDIDLLVTPAQGPAAHAVLEELGFVEGPRSEAWRSHWTPRDSGTIRSLALAHADNPWSLDLHVSLDRRVFRGLTTTLDTPAPVTGERWHEFSRPVHILPQPLLLAYLAVHASSHFYSITLLRLVELVLVIQRDFADRRESWRAFRDLVHDARAGRVAFPALHLAERLAPGTVDPAVLEQLAAAAPPRLRRFVDNSTPASAQRLHPYPRGERYVWVASLRELVGALAEVAWPSDGERLVSPRTALAVQWRRVGGVLRRLVLRRGP